jgi:hypothetical protein
MTDEQKAYWAQQLDWAIKTVGVSGVLLALLLYGMYSIAIHTVDSFKPLADKLVNKHVEFLDRQTQIGEKNQDTLEQLVELNEQTVELVRENAKRIAEEQR